jgi:membrane protein insertase Oxa1/YidC/SpoIIIJ
MLMELYKERGINPIGTLPTLFIQLLVLIGLYSGLRKIIDDPHTIITFSYPFVQHLPWMKELAANIHLFDNTLFGVVDLSRAALPKGGGIYWPAMIIVIGSAVAQFFQSRQLLPADKDQRGLRSILKQASSGEPADQSEVNAAVGRSTLYFLPIMIFFFTVGIASALSLYWLVSGVVAYIQQAIVLRRDEEEMESGTGAPTTRDLSGIPEAEVVETAPKKSRTAGKTKKSAKKKRRKK